MNLGEEYGDNHSFWLPLQKACFLADKRGKGSRYLNSTILSLPPSLDAFSRQGLNTLLRFTLS